MTARGLSGVLTLTITLLLVCGCSDKAGNPSIADGTSKGVDVEAQRKAVEQAARAQRFEDLLGSGKKALDAKHFEEAVKDLEEAVRLQDDPQARELLQQAQKVKDEARKAAYDQAMLRGCQARKEQNYPVAVEAFRDALRQLPENKEAAATLVEAEFHDFLEKGRLALEQGRYADAVKALGESVKRQPNDKDSNNLLKQAQTQRRLQVMSQGKAALKAKQYSEAVRLFTDAKDLLPDAEVTALLVEANFQAKLHLGRQRIAANQFAAAIADLEEANRLKPDHVEVRDLLQRAKEGRKRQDKADYDRALIAGDAAMQRKDYQPAIDAYREALARPLQDGTASSKLTAAQNAKAKKDSYESHIRQGKMQLSTKNYLSAEVELRAALLDMPGDTEAQRLLQQAQNAKAKKLSFDRHMSQGKSHILSKNHRLAEMEFQAALFDIPGEPEAQRSLQQARQGKR